MSDTTPTNTLHGSGRAVEHATGVLAELARKGLSKRAIETAGGIVPLVGILLSSNRSPTAKAHVAAVFARLADANVDDEAATVTQRRTEESMDPQRQSGNAIDETSAAVAAAAAATMAGRMAKADGATGGGRAAAGVGSRRSGIFSAVTSASDGAAARAVAITRAGGVAALVELIGGSAGDTAQCEATAALWALAEQPESRRAIAAAEGIVALVEILGSASGRSQTHAEGALVRLSNDHANRVLIIRQVL